MANSGRSKTGPSKRNRLAGKGKNKDPKSNESTGRDYTYDKKYQKRKGRKKGENQPKNRAARTSARDAAVAAGKVRRGDTTKDVDHKRSLKKGGSNKKSNLRVISSKKNRGDKKR